MGVIGIYRGLYIGVVYRGMIILPNYEEIFL